MGRVLRPTDQLYMYLLRNSFSQPKTITEAHRDVISAQQSTGAIFIT